MGACRDGSAKGYFVTSATPGLFMKPGFFRWWNTAPVVALDVTNPEAVAWFVNRLRTLQEETGIDGFKFDAGVSAFSHARAVCHLSLTAPASRLSCCCSLDMSAAQQYYRSCTTRAILSPSACCRRALLPASAVPNTQAHRKPNRIHPPLGQRGCWAVSGWRMRGGQMHGLAQLSWALGKKPSAVYRLMKVL